jgi:hypothetical protein
MGWSGGSEATVERAEFDQPLPVAQQEGSIGQLSTAGNACKHRFRLTGLMARASARSPTSVRHPADDAHR